LGSATDPAMELTALPRLSAGFKGAYYKTWRSDVVNINTILSFYAFMLSNEFQLSIGNEAIEKWDGKDVVLPPASKSGGGDICPPCPIACSTPGSHCTLKNTKSRFSKYHYVISQNLSPVDNDRQFKHDALWCSQPVKTGKSVGDVIQVPKTSDRPSCGVTKGLKTIE